MPSLSLAVKMGMLLLLQDTRGPQPVARTCVLDKHAASASSSNYAVIEAFSRYGAKERGLVV